VYFVFFDVGIVVGLNDKNVFISFFPASMRFIKHRVSDHLLMKSFYSFYPFY